MSRYSIMAAVVVAALAVAAFTSPWPAEFAALCAAVVVGVSVALFAEVASGGERMRSALPRWVFGLSMARAVAALCIARGAISISGWLAAALNVPELALCVAVAAVLVAVVAILLVGSGAVRVAEVAARFALDALPGRQLGLDAAVQSGAMTPEGAVEGMDRVESQATFYAAMDGALRFLRAEAVGHVFVALVAAAAGAGIHREVWAAAVSYAAAGCGVLLLGTAVASSTCVLAITALPGRARGTKDISVSSQLRLGATATMGIAVVVAVLDLVAGGPRTAAMIGALLLLAAGAVMVWMAQYADTQPRSAEALMTLITGPVLPSVSEELQRQLGDLREAIHKRLGVDPGPVELRIDAQQPERAFSLALRGLAIGEQWECKGEVAVIGQGSDAAPDGRAMKWTETLSGREGTVGCLELVEWWAYRVAVANATIFMTSGVARELAEQIQEAIGSGQQISVAQVMALSWELLSRGLPVPPPHLFADALAGAGTEAQRQVQLVRMSVRTLLAAAGGQIMARQLHQNARQVLRELVEGGFVGTEIEQLRRQIVEEAWEREDWRWPMMIVEGAAREQLEGLLADCRAEVVVVEPEELPTGIGMSSVEVLGSARA